MSEPFLAEIRMLGGNFAPRGWAFCDGQILPINQNQSLYSLLGTTYGGDGRTSFALPDLRSRVSVHQGDGSGLSHYNLGQKGGAEAVSLQTTQIPAHNHAVECVSTEGNEDTPVGHLPGSETAPTVSFWSDAASDGIMKTTMIQNTGGGQDHKNVQPYGVVNFIIALQGLFPSRN